MKKRNLISLSLFTATIVFLHSCTDPNDISNNNKGYIAQEINPAKTFYQSKGVTYKFRLYNFEPTDDNNQNYNNHSAGIYRIMENNGNITLIAQYNVAETSMNGTGAVLNCQGDYINPSVSPKLNFQSKYLTDDFEIINNQLVSFNGTGGGRGGYGISGLSFHNHSLNTHNGPFASSSVTGYMFFFKNKWVIMSLGFNDNYGHPMLYTYNPSNYTWSGEVVSGMDYVQGVLKNIPTTNDASKAGNENKIYWAYLNYDDSPANGKVNIISYDGNAFSAVTSKAIGTIGTGGSYYYKHFVWVYKNPANTDQPYIVVRHHDADIIDIYQFKGTEIALVKANLAIPNTIPIVSGNSRNYKTLTFTGKNVYMIYGFDRNLYKLSGSEFVIDKPEITVENERITAIEGTKDGLLLSVEKTLNTTPKPKTVSDVVFIGD